MTNVYQTDNVLITMGEDFFFQDAEMWFANLDKLISWVKKLRGLKFISKLFKSLFETNSHFLRYANNIQTMNETKYNLIYSTPSCYLKAVYDESVKKNIKWTVKTDDFFPYASDQHSYWSGYFTSRPTLKRYERDGNNFLQVNPLVLMILLM